MTVAQSFVVIDLETTGLPQQGETVKITEIAMQSFSRASLIMAKPDDLSPRVSNKMVFCLNPEKKIHPVAAEMTGLTDTSLGMEKKFDKGLCDLLRNFLDRLPQPICLVAHNGMKFDFPVLLAELSNIGETLAEDILVIDSLNAFKDIVPRGTRRDEIVPFAINAPLLKKTKTAAMLKSHKLNDLYQFLVTSKKRENSHSALGDVTALTECIFSRPQPFLMWSDGQVLKFNSIKKAW